jgi:hypothetical protein
LPVARAKSNHSAKTAVQEKQSSAIAALDAGLGRGALPLTTSFFTDVTRMHKPWGLNDGKEEKVHAEGNRENSR